MSELESQYLEAFALWLRRLPDDARVLAEALYDASLPSAQRAQVAAALNYLVKSLDLIPEGIEDLGFVDDAFVLRVVAAGIVSASSTAERANPVLRDLAGDAALIEQFLGADFSRLVQYAKGLDPTTPSGRSVDAIVGDPAVRDEFCQELRAWAVSYRPPALPRDSKSLIKLRAFLGTKLAS
jgi:uncharacterized membrane protein YkvA (DUF1232 family)